MPNWCSNALKLEGNEDKTKEVLGFIKGDGDIIIDFKKLIPVPFELQNTKDGEAICFYTAYSPPIPFLEKLSEKFPEVKFIMKYYDECMNFIGICEFKNGEGEGRCVSSEDFMTEEGQILQIKVFGGVCFDYSWQYRNGCVPEELTKEK